MITTRVASHLNRVATQSECEWKDLLLISMKGKDVRDNVHVGFRGKYSRVLAIT